MRMVRWMCNVPSKELRERLGIDGMYVCILRVRAQPTLDPYAEAFL